MSRSNSFFKVSIRSSFILALIISIHLSLFLFWHFQNTQIFNAADTSAHYLLTLTSLVFLREKALGSTFMVSGYYPPLFYLVSALLYYVFGASEVSASFVVLLWFFSLLVSTYFIATIVSKKSSALLSTFILGCFPYMTFFSRQVFQEVPVAVFYSLILLIILKFGFHLNEKPNFWLGIIVGLAMLTKWSSAIYLSAPIIWLLFMALKEGRKKVFNFIISFLPAILITAPWYVICLKTGPISAINILAQDRLIYGQYKLSFFEALIWYPKAIIKDMVGLPLTLIAIGGILLMKRANSLLLLFFFLFPILIFTLAPISKNPRFIVPLMPVFAIFCGVGIDSLASRITKTFNIITRLVILAYCSTLFIHSSFGIESLYADDNNLISSVFPQNNDPGKWDGYNPRPQKDDWRLLNSLLDVYRNLVSYIPLREGYVKVLIVSPSHYINYFRIFMARDILQGRGWRIDFSTPGNLACEEKAKDFDFIILEELDYEEEYKKVYNSSDIPLKDLVEKARLISKRNFLERHFRLLKKGAYQSGFKVVSLWENKKLQTMKKIFRDRSFFFPATEPAVDNVVRANIGGFAEFIGASFEQSDNILKATYLWRCLKPIDKRYRIFVHFEIDGRFPEEMGGQDHWPLAGYYHTTEWKTGELIREYYEIPIPKNIKSGTYEVFIGMFDPKTGKQIPCSPRNVIKEEWRIKAGKIKIINKDADEKEN